MDTTPLDDPKLIRAAQQGDAQAISTLYEQHVGKVYRYIFLRVSEAALAEDLTSEVFVRAIETLPKFEQRGVPFLGWLYHIARGLIIDYYRREKRRGPTQSLDDITTHAAADSTEQIVFDGMAQDEILQALAELTEEQQQVLILRFIQGHNLDETAALMGKQEGAVKALQFRALRRLAKRFHGEASDEDS